MLVSPRASSSCVRTPADRTTSAAAICIGSGAIARRSGDLAAAPETAVSAAGRIPLEIRPPAWTNVRLWTFARVPYLPARQVQTRLLRRGVAAPQAEGRGTEHGLLQVVRSKKQSDLTAGAFRRPLSLRHRMYRSLPIQAESDDRPGLGGGSTRRRVVPDPTVEVELPLEVGVIGVSEGD